MTVNIKSEYNCNLKLNLIPEHMTIINEIYSTVDKLTKRLSL